MASVRAQVASRGGVSLCRGGKAVLISRASTSVSTLANRTDEESLSSGVV